MNKIQESFKQGFKKAAMEYGLTEKQADRVAEDNITDLLAKALPNIPMAMNNLVSGGMHPVNTLLQGVAAAHPNDPDAYNQLYFNRTPNPDYHAPNLPNGTLLGKQDRQIP